MKWNYSRYLPSKQFSFIVLSIAVVGVMVWIASVVPQAALESRTPGAVSVEKKILLSGNALDTDGDGLKDWEESLWGTDAQNADTDGDGTNDKKEILAGRNPLLAGPDDSLPSPEALISGNALPDEDDTVTGKITKDVIREYVRLVRSGVDVGESELAEISRQITAKSVREVVVTSDKYTADNLSVIDGVAPSSAIKKYGNGIAEAWTIDDMQNSPSREAGIIERGIIKSDFDALKELSPIMEQYSSLEKRLLSVPVPAVFSFYHLDMVNGVAEMRRALGVVRSFPEDPVAGMYGLAQYRAAAEKTSAALGKITSLMSRLNVVFDEGDAMYGWFR